jgi:integrase
VRGLFDRHVLPVFGDLRLRHLDRERIKRLLADKLRAGYARDTVRLILAALRGLLNAALEDGFIEANPAARLGRRLRLEVGLVERAERVKAFDRGQLRAFLEACRTHTSATVRRYYPPFLVLARTGLRLGEALALKVGGPRLGCEDRPCGADPSPWTGLQVGR